MKITSVHILIKFGLSFEQQLLVLPLGKTWLIDSTEMCTAKRSMKSIYYLIRMQ